MASAHVTFIYLKHALAYEEATLDVPCIYFLLPIRTLLCQAEKRVSSDISTILSEHAVAELEAEVRGRWQVHPSPCHSMPYHTMPFHTMPRHVMPCHVMPCHVTPCHTTPHKAIPHHAIPIHTMSYHAVPCYTTPYQTVPCHTIPVHTSCTPPIHTSCSHLLFTLVVYICCSHIQGKEEQALATTEVTELLIACRNDLLACRNDLQVLLGSGEVNEETRT